MTINGLPLPPLRVMLMIALPLVLTLVMITAIIVKTVSEKVKNSRSPATSVGVKVVGRREQVSGGVNTSHFTSYFATFEDGSGSRVELRLSGSQYGMIAEGDFGRLTYRGTEFISFERDLSGGAGQSRLI